MHNASSPSWYCDAQPQNGLNPALPPCLMLLTDLMPPNTAVSTVLQESSCCEPSLPCFRLQSPQQLIVKPTHATSYKESGLAPSR